MKWLLLALLLYAVTGITACSTDRANLAASERSWKARGSDVLPHTDGERLAVEVMQAGGKSSGTGCSDRR
jgi:hypothetical protein